MTITLTQDSWNHIFSQIGFTSLRSAASTSKNNFLLIAINQYATTIIMGFNLKADDPTFSFKRLSNFQNLINQWIVPPSLTQELVLKKYADFEYFKASGYGMIYKTQFNNFVKNKEFYSSKNYFSDIMIEFMKGSIIKKLIITDCTSIHFKDGLIPLNNISKFIAYYSASAFPGHPAIEDLTLFFLQNSGSALFALEHQEYEKLKELLEKNGEMISADHDYFEELIFASLANEDFKSFELVFKSLEKYMNENLNQENSTIQLFKSAKYYPFIKDDKREAFCKLRRAYKNEGS